MRDNCLAPFFGPPYNAAWVNPSRASIRKEVNHETAGEALGKAVIGR